MKSGQRLIASVLCHNVTAGLTVSFVAISLGAAFGSLLRGHCFGEERDMNIVIRSQEGPRRLSDRFPGPTVDQFLVPYNRLWVSPPTFRANQMRHTKAVFPHVRLVSAALNFLHLEIVCVGRTCSLEQCDLLEYHTD